MTDTDIPQRLGVSTSSFWRLMPPGLLEAASKGKKFDHEQNMLMCDYISEITTAVRNSRISSLECYFMLAWDPEKVWQAMQDALGEHKQLEFWSIHAPYGHLYDPSSPEDSVRQSAVRACIETVHAAKMMGVKVMVVHPGANVDAHISRKERLGLSAETLSEIARIAGKEGVRVAVEPLPKQEVGNTVAELLAIIRAADNPNLGVCLDTNHIFPASALPAAIRDIGDNLISVHISDHDGSGERHWLPYQGIVDWRGIIRALKDVGYQGPLIYETHGFPPPGRSADIVRVIEENYQKLSAETGLASPLPAHVQG